MVTRTTTSRDRSRCFGVLPMFNGAAIMGILQAVLVILLLSTTGVLLNRWHAWRSEYEVHRMVDTSITTSSTSSPIPGPSFATLSTTAQVAHPAAIAVWPEDGKWYRDSALSAFLEVHLTHHVALYCLWLVCLFIFALAFRYRRSALVLPNLVMQVIGLILMLVLIGIVIAKLVLLNSEYNAIVTPLNGRSINEYPGPTYNRDDINMRYAFYAILLGILVICLIAEFVFIWITIEFYQFLRDREHDLYPDEVHHDGRATYHHHEEHRILRDEEDPKHPVRTTHHVTATSVEPNARLYHDTQPVATKGYARGDVMP